MSHVSMGRYSGGTPIAQGSDGSIRPSRNLHSHLKIDAWNFRSGFLSFWKKGLLAGVFLFQGGSNEVLFCDRKQRKLHPNSFRRKNRPRKGKHGWFSRTGEIIQCNEKTNLFLCWIQHLSTLFTLHEDTWNLELVYKMGCKSNRFGSTKSNATKVCESVCVCVFAMGNVFFWFPCNSVPCSPQHFVCFNHVPTRDSTSTVLLHLPSWERSHIPSKFTFESMIFLFPRVGYVIVPCKVYNLCIVECLHKTFARSVDLTCIGAILFLGARWDGWWRIGWKWSFAV